MKRFAFALLLVVTAHPLGAQSIYSAAGLGLPMDPADGRSRALGSFGIGLWGAQVNPNDPAASGMLVIPSAVIVAQPSWVDFERGASETGDFQGTRFPMVGVGYPYRGGTVSVTFGSFLDQHYEGEREVTFDVGGSTSTATDLFEQDGAVSRVTLGYARRIGSSTSVGLNVGRYAGSLVRRLTRDFGDVVDLTSILPFQTGGLWSYSGLSMTGGVTSDLSSIVRVAGSVTWSGTLDATASEDSGGADRSFDLPVQYRLGASAVLAPGLRVAASMVRADWGDTAGSLSTPVAVGTSNGFGVGIELSRARLLGRDAPLRFGYRRSGLPYSLGTGSANESVWSGGFGVAFAAAEELVLAGADFALERGTRSDSLLKESFWRATLSLKVSGF